MLLQGYGNTPDRESKQSPQRARLSGHSVVLIYHIDIDDIMLIGPDEQLMASPRALQRVEK